MTYSTTPQIAGANLPRPNGVSEGATPVRSSVTLAAGATRAYDNGVRRTFDLSWSKLTEGELAVLRAAVQSAAYVAYRHLDGISYVVEGGEVSAAAVAGTDPVRFSVSVTLTEQRPSR